MTYNANILLGRISKTYGHFGFVVVRLQGPSDNIWNNREEPVFIEVDGKPVPFFIEDSEQPDRDHVRVKFDGYDNSEVVEEFVGCNVLTASSRVEENDDLDVMALVGYTLLDGNNNEVGIIDDIQDNASQYLLSVLHGDNSFFVPIHEDLIIDLNQQDKTITLSIAEGLIDLND